MHVSFERKTKPYANLIRMRLVVAVLMVLAMQLNELTHASSLGISDFRLSTGGDKFPEVRQAAIAFSLSSPEPLRARRLELAFGVLTATSKSTAFVSLGPVWRFPDRFGRLFLEFGFSPTLLGGSTIDGRDLGGNFHFTSSLAIGTSLGASHSSSISLRIQHLSNGGLNSTNPGIDMIGLNFHIYVSK